MIESERLIEIKINSLIKEAQRTGDAERVEAFLRALKTLGIS